MVSLRVLKTEILISVFRTLSNAYDEVLLTEIVNFFQRFTMFAKKLRYSCSTNPRYASDIFLTIFIVIILDCLKQTYQIFRTAICQDVSEDLILSYDFISLFPLI